MKRMTTIALSTVLLTTSTFALAAQQNWKDESRDAWIDGKAETTLLLNTNLNSFDINTDVTDGVVTLTGDVNSNLEKSLAEELIVGLDGVKKVDNKLTILDSNKESEQDSETLSALTDTKITTVLKSRLLMSQSISAMDIEVTTTDQVVELKGTVKNDAEHDLALSMARNAQDVLNVVDKLTVTQ
jgi:osmotically-inducible protein OsmY